jgi:hypothetical protein
MLPPQLEEYIQDLDPASQNNSKSITRQNFERILKQPPQIAQMIIRKNYGIDLDTDHVNGRDDGEPYKSY